MKPVESIRECWNSEAAAYEAFNSAPDSYSRTIERPCIQGLLPELKGKAVLDLGCGTGIFTFLLEQFAPAELVGLDLSEGMLEIAREKARKQGSMAQFVQGDASHASERLGRRFDLVFSSTMTHYIADLDGLFADIARCLQPDGRCILSVIHPVYSAQYPIGRGDRFPEDDEWTVRYLDRRERAYIQPWIEYNDECENRLSRSVHHTFGDYVGAIVGAGLRLCGVHEPMPPEEWKKHCPGRYEGFIETPTYMILEIGRQ